MSLPVKIIWNWYSQVFCRLIFYKVPFISLYCVEQMARWGLLRHLLMHSIDSIVVLNILFGILTLNSVRRKLFCEWTLVLKIQRCSLPLGLDLLKNWWREEISSKVNLTTPLRAVVGYYKFSDLIEWSKYFLEIAYVLHYTFSQFLISFIIHVGTVLC